MEQRDETPEKHDLAAMAREQVLTQSPLSLVQADEMPPPCQHAGAEFAEQLGAIFRFEQIRRAIRIRRVVISLPALMVFEPGRCIMDSATIGPTIELHLQHAKIQAQLDFSPSVETLDHPHGNLVGAIGPIADDGIDVGRHVVIPKEPVWSP